MALIPKMRRGAVVRVPCVPRVAPDVSSGFFTIGCSRVRRFSSAHDNAYREHRNPW
jgi:hypothetical protein